MPKGKAAPAEPPVTSIARTKPVRKIFPSRRLLNELNEVKDESGGRSKSQEDGTSSSEEQSSSSVPSIKPENLAVRHMQFREKRGAKMNSLIARKKMEEEDDFWTTHGANFFGDLDQADKDNEDYEVSSEGKDDFDSDFEQTESEEEPQEKPVEEEKQEVKQLKKVVFKVQNQVPPLKPKAVVGKTKIQQPVEQGTNRYIHQLFKQEDLLGEAAQTEYLNYVSLQKLISIETEKKDFQAKDHIIDGSKIIYRDRLGTDGKRIVTYELVQTEVPNIQTLTNIWQLE